VKKSGILLISLAVLFCARGNPARADKRVVARVNGVRLSAGQLMSVVPPPGADTQAWQESKRATLERMIDQTLMLQLALKLGYQDSISATLEKQMAGLARQELRQRAEKQAVTRADVARESLLLYTNIHLKLMEVPAYDTAQLVATRLKNGVPFESLAVRFSRLKLKSPDGDLGFGPKAGVPPEVMGALEGLKPGEATGLVVRGSDYDFVKYEGEQMVPPESMTQTHTQFESSARRRKAEEYLRGLPDRVQYDEPLLDRLTRSPDSLQPSDAESVVARLPDGYEFRVDSLLPVVKSSGDTLASERRKALKDHVENDALERELRRLKLDKTTDYQTKLKVLTDRVLYQFCSDRQIDVPSRASDSEVNAYFHQHAELFPGKELTSDVAANIRGQLFQTRREERIKTLMTGLRDSSAITIDEKLLAALKPVKTAR
jgi:hypothetical protein